MLSRVIQPRVVRDPDMKMTTVTRDYLSEWLCINNMVGSLCHCMTTSFHASSRLDLKFIFTSHRDQLLFQLFYQDVTSQCRSLESLLSATDLNHVSVLDITYVKSVL